MNTPELKGRIERLLSEILTDKYDCKVVLKFETLKKEKEHEQNHH